jgi:hypothetical protein
MGVSHGRSAAYATKKIIAKLLSQCSHTATTLKLRYQRVADIALQINEYGVRNPIDCGLEDYFKSERVGADRHEIRKIMRAGESERYRGISIAAAAAAVVCQ